MKIIHIDLAQTWRGGQNQVFLLLKKLQQYDDVQTILITVRGSALAKKVETACPKTHIIELKSPRNIVRILLRLTSGRDTLVHCHSAQAHSLALLSKILFRWKAGLLVHRRVDFVPQKKIWNRWKYCSSLVDGYIAISKNIKEILLKQGIPEKKVHLVYSGVDFASLEQHKPADLSPLLGEKPRKPVFVNVGSLTDHKGQIYLLKAARVLNDKGINCQILICGEGELRGKLEQFIAQYALEKMVVLAGFQADIPGILKSSDFFVMSSHLEGLGTSVIDALYLKKPSIVTRAGGIPEIVQNGRLAVCVPPRNPEELAGAMEKFLNSKSETLKEMAERAHEEVKKQFHYEKMGEEIVYLYKKYLYMEDLQ